MFNKPTVRFSLQSRQSTAEAFPECLECLTREVFPYTRILDSAKSEFGNAPAIAVDESVTCTSARKIGMYRLRV